MSSNLGRGSYPHVQQRRDRILAALFAHTGGGMTTAQIMTAVGERRQSVVYADLRTLCGSHTMRYDEQHYVVNKPGYPVRWWPWNHDDPDKPYQWTGWDLTSAARAAMLLEVDDLEAAFAQPAAAEREGEGRADG